MVNLRRMSFSQCIRGRGNLMMNPRVLGMLSLLFLSFQAYGQSAIGVSEILGRPTANSVTVSALFDQQVQVYFQYGASPGSFTTTTATQTSVVGAPVEVAFGNLLPNKRYYYRTCYKKPSDATFIFGTEHTFYTQRAPGSTFTFTMEADPHPYDKKGSHTLWPIALKNQLADNPDFILDLGDTFGDDHNPTSITSNEIRQLHLDDRPFFGLVCHSAPLFFCLGNHEGESGYYLLQTPPNNLGVYATLWRKFYYPNPLPDGFYSGNTTSEGFGMGLPANYYAWEWGDALFVVLDAYRGYTANAKPRGWEWTLGKDQYDWLKRTLETSKVKFKFVFAHHILGETRGAVAVAKTYEWGGYEGNGTTWGFTTNRPGWAMPIHQLMVSNGVNIFFQGHDHLFAKEVLDGVVYQEVPMPSDSTYIIGTRDNGDAYTDLTMDASGHLRVTVSSTSVTVDYVRAWLPADETAQHKNREVAYSYSVGPKTTAVESERVIPTECALEQNYPNPFSAEGGSAFGGNPTTTIGYDLPRLTASGSAEVSAKLGSTASWVTLKVYDLLGREVATLVNQEMQAGRHTVQWNAANVPAGVYFYQMRVNSSVYIRKAVVLK